MWDRWSFAPPVAMGLTSRVGVVAIVGIDRLRGNRCIRIAAKCGSEIHRPPGSSGCRDQFTGDRPGLVRGQEYRDECDLRGVHHAAYRIAARRVGSEILS